MRNGYVRAGRLAAVATAVALVAAACGGGATPSPAVTQAPASVTPSEAPAGSPAPSEAVDEYQVAVATDATAGDYLTGKDGLALYVFKNDTGPTSTCYDDCATAWPPLLAEGASVMAAPTISGAFATTDRTDGTKQVTYNGAPLYYFQGDKAPGDITGQGLNDVWFLAAP